MAFAFRDSAALEVAIRSGLVSRDAVAGPATLARGAGDAIVIAPERTVPAADAARLRAAGVDVDAVLPEAARPIRCWAEAIAPVRTRVAALPSLVIFETAAADELIDLAAELVRLGCDRQELMIAGARGLIRAVDPPTYTIVRALDRERGLRAFAPDPARQDRVWTELGYHHPLAEHLRAATGALLFCAGDGWRSVVDAGWRGIDDALELVVPGRAEPHVPGAVLDRRRIELRLARGRRETPSMWVLRERATETIDRLLAHLPDDVVDQLDVAVTAATPPIAILRARTGRRAPPDLALAAEAYAPLAHMPDVFAPADAIVEPPLGRDRLRAVLGVAERELLWLAPAGTSAFRVERIADSAFAPLAEWADYVVQANAPALVPWLRAEVDFAPFVVASAAPPTAPAERAESVQRRAPAPAPKPAVAPPPLESVAPRTAVPALREPTVAIDAELAACEAAFVACDAPADAAERRALFDQLGGIYARLGRLRDAGLCISRAIWDAPPDAAAARLDTWLAMHAPRTLDDVLAASAPATDDVRLVAILAARGAPGVARDPHRVTRWLDAHDGDLDARTLWLARVGLARLGGGDALLLAHARDRVLAALAGGLPVERELPAFMKLAHRNGALGTASGEHLAGALDELWARVEAGKRKRTPLEAPPHLTNAYAAHQIAWGFARIARAERARALVAVAREWLAPHIADPVHSYLADAFGVRVDQAIAGLPPEAPLPDELAARLAALDRTRRYKAERLRERSRILSPIDRPDAFRVFVTWTDPGGARPPPLANVPPAERAAAIRALVDDAARDAADRARLLERAFAAMIELPEANAAPILEAAAPLVATVAPAAQAPLAAQALVAAGHFGRADLVPPLAAALRDALGAVDPAGFEHVLARALRALRRIGLRADAAELLVAAGAARTGTPMQILRARLAIAAGLSYLGDFARARPSLDDAHAALAGATAPDRLELVRALALAYAQAPLPHALAGIAALSDGFTDISDSASTNSHYCLSVLDFLESLVLGLASDDLALGEAGRRFIEDDEHLIRRRIHEERS